MCNGLRYMLYLVHGICTLKLLLFCLKPRAVNLWLISVDSDGLSRVVAMILQGNITEQTHFLQLAILLVIKMSLVKAILLKC